MQTSAQALIEQEDAPDDDFISRHLFPWDGEWLRRQEDEAARRHKRQAQGLSLVTQNGIVV